MSGKQWLIRVLVITLTILIMLGGIVYLWDPYNYYRINDGKLKYVASAYIDAGIIRNAEYDAAMIGSSVSQNFDVQRFRDKMGIELVKVNTGGISLEQRDLFYQALERENKADIYFIEVAISTFNAPDDKLEDTPVYLYDDCVWNDYKYLYGYETWMRGMPVSMAYFGMELLGIKTGTMHNLESVDNVGDWYYRKKVGKTIFLNNYLAGSGSISKQSVDGMYERMINNVDKKLTTIIKEDNQYVFYFPPYSAALWSDAESAGYAEIWYDVKQYCIEKLLDYPNVEVYDFQYTDEICNLENYRDVTHYGKSLNDWMTDCFASGEWRITAYSDIERNIERLKTLVMDFRSDNCDWIK